MYFARMEVNKRAISLLEAAGGAVMPTPNSVNDKGIFMNNVAMRPRCVLARK